MKAFCLETSNPKNLVLAFKNRDSEYFIEFRGQVYKSELIWNLIEEGFKRINLQPQNLDFVGAGLGPGSFTGLRIGLSIIKAISLATTSPIIGVRTFDLLAKNVPFFKRLCILFDAKKKLFYTAIYTKEFKKVKKKLKESLKSFESLKKILRPGDAILGDGVKLLGKDFDKRFEILDEEFSYVKPQVLMKECLEKFKKRKFLKIENLNPLYLHPLECQAKVF